MHVTGRGAMAHKDTGHVLATWDFYGSTEPQEITCPQGVAEEDLTLVPLDDYTQEEYHEFIVDHHEATYDPTPRPQPIGAPRGQFLKHGQLHPVELRRRQREESHV